jgi:hypothetical protein
LRNLRTASGQGRWIAYLNFEGKRQHLGLFDSEEDAARAYNSAAEKIHKEFARLNLTS